MQQSTKRLQRACTHHSLCPNIEGQNHLIPILEDIYNYAMIAHKRPFGSLGWYNIVVNIVGHTKPLRIKLWVHIINQPIP